MPEGWQGTSEHHRHFPTCPSLGCLAVLTLLSCRSHDFIGEFATSYRELSRAQSQFTVYEVGQGDRQEGPQGSPLWGPPTPVPAGAEPQEEMQEEEIRELRHREWGWGTPRAPDRGRGGRQTPTLCLLGRRGGWV